MPGLSSLQVNIKDQPHNLAWINEAEQDLLKDLGGSGRPGPMGIPAYFSEGSDDNDEGEGEGEAGDGTSGGNGGSGGSGGGGGEGSGEGNEEDDFDTDRDEDFDFDQGPAGAAAAAADSMDPDALSTDTPGLSAAEAAAAAAAADALGAEATQSEQQAAIDAVAMDFALGAKDALKDYAERRQPLIPEDLPYIEDPIVKPPSQYRTIEYTPENTTASGIINALFTALVPGATIARLAGFNPGKLLAGETTRSYYSDKLGNELNPITDPDSDRDDGNADEEIIPEIVEEKPEEEEEQLGTMEQFFVDRDAAQGLNQNEVLNNMIDRLGIQNRTIEPFNEWLAGQSEAMRAADMATQTNEYRKSLRDQTSPSQSYLPRVQPAADRTIEQSFINNLYPSSKKTSATDALYAELGI